MWLATHGHDMRDCKFLKNNFALRNYFGSNLFKRLVDSNVKLISWDTVARRLSQSSPLQFKVKQIFHYNLPDYKEKIFGLNNYIYIIIHAMLWMFPKLISNKIETITLYRHMTFLYVSNNWMNPLQQNVSFLGLEPFNISTS